MPLKTALRARLPLAILETFMAFFMDFIAYNFRIFTKTISLKTFMAFIAFMDFIAFMALFIAFFIAILKDVVVFVRLNE